LFSILFNGVGVFLYLAMGADRLAMAQQDSSGNEFRSWTSSVAWFMSAQVLLGTLTVIIGLYRSIVSYRKRVNRKRNVWVILVLTVHAMAIVLLILVYLQLALLVMRSWKRRRTMLAPTIASTAPLKASPMSFCASQMSPCEPR
jgi:cytochrome bd-type quinol oxidase subunit 2